MSKPFASISALMTAWTRLQLCYRYQWHSWTNACERCPFYVKNIQIIAHQFWVRFSVQRMSAYLLALAPRSVLARSTLIIPAEQPIPTWSQASLSWSRSSYCRGRSEWWRQVNLWFIEAVYPLWITASRIGLCSSLRLYPHTIQSLISYLLIAHVIAGDYNL